MSIFRLIQTILFPSCVFTGLSPENLGLVWQPPRKLRFNAELRYIIGGCFTTNKTLLNGPFVIIALLVPELPLAG